MEEPTFQEEYKNRMVWAACFATFTPMIITWYVVVFHPGFIFAMPNLQKTSHSPALVPKETLGVRAKLDFPEGTTISEEMLELVWVPSETQFGSVVRNLSDAVGQRAGVKITRGRLIRSAQIAAVSK